MSWDERPTEGQVKAVGKLRGALGIREPLEEWLSTRLEARYVQFGLLCQLKTRRGGVYAKAGLMVYR